MENKKQKGCSSSSSSSSSSSLTSQLFGPPEYDVLASIFPPSKSVGRNYYAYSEARGSWQKESCESENHKLSTKQDGLSNKDRSSFYQQEGAEPSYLSSSLYYGGQETYSRPTTHSNSYAYPKFKKDDREDDPSGASRGNWWQGSLYY